MVLNGVGAATIISQDIGKFTDMKELILIGHGINSLVSG